MLVGRLSPRWSSSGLAPFLGRPGQCGYFCTTPERPSILVDSKPCGWVGGRGLWAPHQQREDVWPQRMSLSATGSIHGGSSVESGIESRAFWPPSSDLTTWSPRYRCATRH
ncbi:hypothetical protein AVEN_197807-1 [Araneus ventricosus]|uniref:Uncharacterized protein n=1 Tax=Araneus ventricosus TaxID=182803 RepID=A0A4Y2NMR6_ARAVE|nr:hypothetical protein AVEN_197807-1 [Araneus ventricosus]